MSNKIIVPTEQTDNSTVQYPGTSEAYDYNIPYTEPEERDGGCPDEYIEDGIPDKIPLISSKGWERSFSFCKEKMSDGRYRSSYLVYDPGHPYIQPISDGIKTILGEGYVPSMPESAIILCHLSGILFNRAEKMLDSSALRRLADMRHDDIRKYIEGTEGIDRITFKMTDYCRATERKKPGKLAYKCILNQLANCTTLMGAILEHPDNPKADYFPVIEDLVYEEGIVTFRSYYMAMLVARVIQSDIIKDGNGNATRKSKKGTASKPIHSYQMDATLLKKRNRYAIDIVGNICVLLDQAGKHPGVTPHTAYKSLIQRSGTLRYKGNPTKCNAVNEAWKLLPKTHLKSKYPGIEFPTASANKSMIEEGTLNLPHDCTKCGLDRCSKKKCPQKVIS